MKTKAEKSRKTSKGNRPVGSHYFDNFARFGLSGDLPDEAIKTVKTFIVEALRTNKIRLSKSPDQQKLLTDEMAKGSLHLQAFAINVLKLTPHRGAHINLLDYNLKFKKVFPLTLNDLKKLQRKKDHYSNLAANFYDYEDLPHLIEEVSINIKLNGDKTPKKIRIPQSIKQETLSDLAELLTKLTGRIDSFADLAAKKFRTEKVIMLWAIDAVTAFLRELVFNREIRDQKPTEQELLITVIFLVAAGIFPRQEYYKASEFRRMNGVREVNDSTRLYDQERTIRITRPYTLRLTELLITTMAQAKGGYYNGYNDFGYPDIPDLLTIKR